MRDLVLLRCTHCRSTIPLVVYEQRRAYVSRNVTSTAQPSLIHWLIEHIAHHPAVAGHAFDLDSDAGFEVVTFSQLQDERDAADRAGLDAI